MNRISFTISGEPYGKKNLQPFMIKGKVRAYSPKENNFYMDRVIGILNELDVVKTANDVIFPKDKAVRVYITACFPIPNSEYRFYKKKNAWDYTETGKNMLLGKLRPTKKPDLDNISKVICDGISHQGKIWQDDSQVAEEFLYKTYSKMPRVEVVIEEIVV